VERLCGEHLKEVASLPAQMTSYIHNEILKQLLRKYPITPEHPTLLPSEIENICNDPLVYLNLIRKYRPLNTYLQNAKTVNQSTIQDILEYITYAPFTRYTMQGILDSTDLTEVRHTDYLIYKIADLLKRAGLLKVDIIDERKEGVIYSRRLKTPRMWYASWHNGEDIQALRDEYTIITEQYAVKGEINENKENTCTTCGVKYVNEHNCRYDKKSI
jgi:hypothetical protein